jgi:RNA polymerase sigma-54 factor
MAALLDNLDLLARRDMAALRKLCGVDDEDLREMVAEIRALTPRPGAAFHTEPAPDPGARRPCARDAWAACGTSS